MKFFIHAFDQTYEGFEGKYIDDIIEADTIEEVEQYGRDLAADVILDYGLGDDLYDEIMEQYEDEFSDEFQEAFAERIAEESGWEIYRIKDEFADMEIEKLNRIYSSIGMSSFVEEYCDSCY